MADALEEYGLVENPTWYEVLRSKVGPCKMVEGMKEAVRKQHAFP